MIVIFAKLEDNDMAVLEREDGTTYDVQRHLLPADAKPGDSLEVLPDDLYRVLKAETKERQERVQELLDDLWEK